MRSKISLFQKLLGISPFLIIFFSGSTLPGAQQERLALRAMAYEGMLTGESVMAFAPGTPVEDLAEEFGLVLVQPVGGLPRTWLVRPIGPYSLQGAVAQARELAHSPWVQWTEPEVFTRLEHRALFPFTDGLFRQQWHLRNIGQYNAIRSEDINVLPVWEAGFTGAGSVIAIVDDGMDRQHPNLIPNLRMDLEVLSDFWGGPGMAPNYGRHGTPVAGIAAAAPADRCGVGVAYGAGILNVPLLDGFSSPSFSAHAMWPRSEILREKTDIYSNSWGPGSPPGTVSLNLGYLSVRESVRIGAREGRGGLGSIYVWAVGNHGAIGGNANYDGYSSLPETITVGAVGHDGAATSYTNPGANLMVVAPSGDQVLGITSTDRLGPLGYAPGDCTTQFSGTSASTPMVSGVIALMLEANPNLGWRDVQHILAHTAVRTDPDSNGWHINGAGFHVHHDYGFGRVDATGAVALAEVWENRPPATLLPSGLRHAIRDIPINSLGIEESHQFEQDLTVEHVEVTLSIEHNDWGHLRVTLISPSGTVSVLMDERNDHLKRYTQWTFLSVRNWGESSQGTWRVRVQDRNGSVRGRWNSWSMRIHGTEPESPRNQAPIARDLNVEINEIPFLLDPLANDSDPDGDTLRILSLRQPRYGTVAMEGSNQVRYTPLPEHRGADRFSYTVWDGKDGVSHAFVLIENPLPGALDDHIVTRIDQSITFDVLHNDFNFGTVQPSVEPITSPQRGDLTNLGNGQFRYTPRAGYFGMDQFRYQLLTSNGLEDTATVSLEVQPQTNASLQFTRSDDVVSLGTTTILNLQARFTLEAMIHPTGWGPYGLEGYGRIYDKENLVFFLNGRNSPIYPDGCLVFVVVQADGSTGIVTSEGGSVALDRWQHVAVSYDGFGDVRFYVEGKRVPTRTVPDIPSPASPVRSSPDDPLLVGNSAQATRAFDGYITDLRVWNRILTLGELGPNRPSNPGSHESGLIGHWPMREGAGATLANRVIEGPHGEVRGPHWAPILAKGMEGYQGKETALFADALPIDPNWWHVPWFGWVHFQFIPIVWTEPFGWTFASKADDNLWIYQYSTGDWIYTGPDFYPYFYSSGSKAWTSS